MTSHAGPLRCLLVLAVEWVWGAIDPLYRDLWFYENLLVFLALIALAVTYKRFRFSTLSYVLFTAFLILHLIGAHFGYNEVPPFDRYEEWGWSRNPYDRIVHFAYGFLLAIPLRELLRRLARTTRAWSDALSLSIVMATSMLYELFEWGFVAIVHPGMEPSFLGAQGDPWDAHADMMLASIGGLLMLALARLFRRTGTPGTAEGD